MNNFGRVIFPFPAVMTNENVDNALAIGLGVGLGGGILALCIVGGVVIGVVVCFKMIH